MLKRISKFLFSPVLGKTWGQRFFAVLYVFSLRGMNFGAGGDWTESGELWVVNYLAKKSKASGKPFNLFDVGANIGNYSKAAAEVFTSRGAELFLYSFEPSRQTFQLMSKKLEGIKNSRTYNFALGDSASTQKLYSDQPGSGLASLFERDLKQYKLQLKEQESVKVETLDNFCAQNGISAIDFLKLDVEGFELKVLQGAKNMLAAGTIGSLQFEFGGTDIDARVFFRDFFRLLEAKYNIYRVLKNGLYPIAGYREEYEIFNTTNYFAELK